MKIKVKTEDARFKLWLPLSIVKWKFIWRLIEKKAVTKSYIDEEGNEVTKNIDIDIISIKNCIIDIYKELKRWKRKYGPLTIVDVRTSDAVVKITI